MSYIAAVLLMLLSEEEAFWALVVLLEKPKYLSELFDSSLNKYVGRGNNTVNKALLWCRNIVRSNPTVERTN